MQKMYKQAKVHDLKKHIDQMVYKSYDLTPEGTAIMEEKGNSDADAMPRKDVKSIAKRINMDFILDRRTIIH